MIRVVAKVMIGAAALTIACSACAEEPPALPSHLPDLNVPKAQWGDDRKYVVLYKAGVSAEEAEADFRFCWRFLAHGVQRTAPGFVPWQRSDAPHLVNYGGGPYGLVGLAIASILAGPIERSYRQSRLYACMLPRGYDRYRTSEDVWRQLNDDANPAQSIHMQALIASGPVPPTDKAEP